MKTNKIKLLLSCGALVVLGAASLQGCSSSDDSSTSTGGTSAGGTGTGGTSSGGKASGGTAGKTGTAGTSAGGSGTAGSSTAGTSAGGTSAAAGATGSEGGEPGAAGAPGAPTQAELCTTFCADEETTCTFGAATAAPYTDSNACLAACNGFTLGDVGVYPDGPTTGDTFACRRWHLSKAGDTGPKATHCPHTGAISVNAFGDATATGPCK